MLTKEADPEAEGLGYDAHVHAEVKQFSQHDLEDHAAFVVQQMTPILGRHALKVRLLAVLPDHSQGRHLVDDWDQLFVPPSLGCIANVF